MPIHDQSYRRYGGARTSAGRAWTVIAKAGIMTMLRKRLFIGLLLASWLQFVVRAVLLYFAANYPQTTHAAPTSITTIANQTGSQPATTNRA